MRGALVLVGLTVACGGDGASLDAPRAVTALFSVPRGGRLAAGADFYALPFPHDFHRTPGGLDLSLVPQPNPAIADYVTAMETRLDGFGCNAAIFARFDGPIDPDSLPATPADARADGASVYLVDVDRDSPERGKRWPLRVRYRGAAGATIGPHWLAALPYPGFPLAGGRTYALVITTRVHAPDGTPVIAGDDWRALDGAPADPDLARARDATLPLLAWLDEPGGDERADVVSAAVFTTQRATALMPLLRGRVRALPAPLLRDVVASAPVDGYVAYDGVFDAPNFQSGDVPYTTDGGEILLDTSDGLPIVQRMEPLRVSFTVPEGPTPPTGWPVAIYAHGTGGSYHSFQDNGTARRLAAEGIAVISIDQVLHGPRNPAGEPERAFFNLQNPLSQRDNVMQSAADDFSLVRVIEGDARFDPDRIYFFGHSQGGVTGPPFVAHEPAVRGAVLSAAAGLIYPTLLDKTEPADFGELLPIVLGDPNLDELSPTLALMQTWIERADPVNYGALLSSRNIFQTEGLEDAFTPPAGIEALAVSIGGDLVAPELRPLPGLALRGRTTATAPVTGNLGGATVVLLQYAAPTGVAAHFVALELPSAQHQSARFLGTLAATGAATVVPAP